jgi:hypothetical protein
MMLFRRKKKASKPPIAETLPESSGARGTSVDTTTNEVTNALSMVRLGDRNGHTAQRPEHELDTRSTSFSGATIRTQINQFYTGNTISKSSAISKIQNMLTRECSFTGVGTGTVGASLQASSLTETRE